MPGDPSSVLAALGLDRRAEQLYFRRIASELPTRMFIFGDSHAVLPEPIGCTDEPRVHIRQRSVVASLRTVRRRVAA